MRTEPDHAGIAAVSVPSFPLLEELHAKIIQLLDALERTEDATRHRKALGDLVVELTSAGMDDFFLKPLALAKAGFVMQQSASFGVGSAASMMAPVIRTVVGYMDQAQLIAIAGYIRHLMR